MSDQAVISVSGGMDSATAVYEAMDRGYDPYFLHTSYGQETESKERECAEALADEVEMPFLGKIPLDPSIREGGDEGRPMVLREGETAEALQEFAGQTANMQGIVHRQRVSRQRQ